MTTLTKTRTTKVQAAAAIALIIALLGGVFGVNAAWGDNDNVQAADDQSCDGKVRVAGYIESDDPASSKVPYSVVSTDYLFPSRLELDPSQSTSFDISVSGTDSYTVENVTDKVLHNDTRGALGKFQNIFDFKYNKLGGGEGDTGGRRTGIGAWALAFGERALTEGAGSTEAGIQAANEAAEQATVTIDYGVVGTYAGSPVRMTLTVFDIVPAKHFEMVDDLTAANNGPVFQFATDPSYGVYFYNVHSAKFDIKLTYDGTNTALKADDIYLTQSSLSYWHGRGVREQTKPLSDLRQVYYSEESNIGTKTSNQMLIDRIEQQGEGHEGFFTPFSGELKDINNNGHDYVDTVGHEWFPRNAVTFQYKDTSHMDFENSSSSNTMWFTIYPQALTNHAPAEPTKSVYTAPTKGVYAQGAAVLEGDVYSGGDVEYVIDQEVNKLGISSLVRYHQFSMTDTLPDVVEITDYEVRRADADEALVSKDNPTGPQGTIVQEGQKVTFTADKDWLGEGKTVDGVKYQMQMEGEHYQLVIKGKVKEGATGSFENTGETAINGKDGDSCAYNHFNTNAVKVNVAEPDTSRMLTNLDEEFTFKVNTRVPEDATKIVITDELEDILEVVSASIDGAASYTDETSGNVVKFSAADPTADRGNTVTLTVVAKIREGATEADLEKYLKQGGIPNTAEVQVNDRPAMESNTVVVVPPPVKKIDGEVHKSLGNREQEFTYSITHVVPEKVQSGDKSEKVVGLKFSDSIDPVLDFAGNVEVALSDGTVVKTVEVDPKAEKVEFALTGSELANVAGKAITVTFKAKFDPSVTDEQVEARITKVSADDDAVYGVGGADHAGVPNTATFSYTPENGSDLDLVTNTVTVERPKDPEKFVNGQKGTVELKTRPEKFTYTVMQLVPSNAVEVAFEDNIAEELEVLSASVDGAAAYEDLTEGNAVKFATDDAAADRGKTVTLTIEAKIRDGVTDEQLVAKYGSINVPNQATVVIDGQGRPTNTVYVRPPQEDPEKTINGQKEKVELENRSKEFTYEVTQTVPGGTTQATFTDKLEDVLEVVSYEVNHDAFKASFDEETNTVTATASGTPEQPIVAKDKDAVVTLTIVAKIREDVTDEELMAKYQGTTTVPNKATVSIDNTSKFTNIVEVTPPDEPGNDPIKRVNGEIDITLDSRPEVFTYTISQQLPGDAKTALFEDTLEDVLEIVGMPTIDGAATYVVEVNGNKVTATGANVVADRNKVVTLTIKAKIRDDVTDEELMAKYQGTTTVPNKATVTINNKPNTTNTVTVTPPDNPREDPEKKINGQKDLVTLANRTDEFTYTVSQKIPEGAKTVTFEDTLEDVLEIAGTPTIDGAATYDVAIDGNKVVASTQDAKADWNAVVTLTIQAKISEGVTDAQLLAKYKSLVVPNKATVTINDIPRTTNEVDVTPPPEETEITKTVNDAQHADLEAAEEVFTYQIKVDVPYDAEKVVVTDTLVDELEFASTAEQVAVDFGEEDIDALVAIDGQTLTVTFDTVKKVLSAAADDEAAADEAAADDENKVLLTTGDKEEAEGAEGEGEANAADDEAEAGAAAGANADAGAEETVLGDIRAKSVTVTFQAKIRAGADISKYLDDNGNPRVPNTASYTINDDPNRTFESNTVTVTPPAPPVDEPEKFINGQKEPVMLANRTDTFTYTVTQAIPANAVSVTFEDELEDVLEVVSASIDGAASYTDETSGNVVKFSTADPAADRGNTVTLTIVAKIRDGITDEQLVAKYGSTSVPNVATVTINGNPKATNVVVVEPPVPEEIVPVDPERPNTPPEEETPVTPDKPNTPNTGNPVPTSPAPTATPTPAKGMAKTFDAARPFVIGLVCLVAFAGIMAVVAMRRRQPAEEVVIPRGNKLGKHVK